MKNRSINSLLALLGVWWPLLLLGNVHPLAITINVPLQLLTYLLGNDFLLGGLLLAWAPWVVPTGWFLAAAAGVCQNLNRIKSEGWNKNLLNFSIFQPLQIFGGAYLVFLLAYALAYALIWLKYSLSLPT